MNRDFLLVEAADGGTFERTDDDRPCPRDTAGLTGDGDAALGELESISSNTNRAR